MLSEHGDVGIRDISMNTTTRKYTLPGSNTGHLHQAAAILASHSLIVTGDRVKLADNNWSDTLYVQFWNIETGKLCYTIQTDLHWEVGYITISRDGKKVAAVDGNRTVKIQTPQCCWTWKVPKSCYVPTPSGKRVACAFSEDGETLAFSDAEGIRLFSSLNGEGLVLLHSIDSYCISYFPGGETIAVTGDTSVGNWDVEKWREEAKGVKTEDNPHFNNGEFELDVPKYEQHRDFTMALDPGVRSCAFVAWSTVADSLLRWEFKKGEITHELELCVCCPIGVAFPHDRVLAKPCKNMIYLYLKDIQEKWDSNSYYTYDGWLPETLDEPLRFSRDKTRLTAVGEGRVIVWMLEDHFTKQGPPKRWDIDVKALIGRDAEVRLSRDGTVVSMCSPGKEPCFMECTQSCLGRWRLIR